MREMPTAAKLVGAICFAAVGALAAAALAPTLPDQFRAQWFVPVNAAIGALVGWRVMGRSVGDGIRRAMISGLGSATWLLFWALVVFSLREMLIRSLDRRYGNPTDALTNVVVILEEFFRMAMVPEVVIILVVGGLIGGLMCELADRRWP